ncbi:MAG: hypothetical protein AB7E12_12610 [Burkholderiaceae bacterium]
MSGGVSRYASSGWQNQEALLRLLMQSHRQNAVLLRAARHQSGQHVQRIDLMRLRKMLKVRELTLAGASGLE